MFLTDEEADAIDVRIGKLEARTGVQIVTAVVGKSDTYVELPWKAFAFGAALGGLAVVLADLARPQWVTANTLLVGVTTILGTALALALLAVFAPAFARLFLHAERRDLEVRQYAHSVFLTHELFSTRARHGVLILMSLFERRIEVLPDKGFQGRVGPADWDVVVATMTPMVGGGSPFPALEAGLAAVEALLVAKGFQPGDGRDELPNRPVEERGE
jgi:putative membrane protein